MLHKISVNVDQVKLKGPSERKDFLKDFMDRSAFNFRGREFHNLAPQYKKLFFNQF